MEREKDDFVADKKFTLFHEMVSRFSMEPRIFWRRNFSCSGDAAGLEVGLVTGLITALNDGGVIGLLGGGIWIFDVVVGSGDFIGVGGVSGGAGAGMSTANTPPRTFSVEDAKSLSSTTDVDEQRDKESSSSS